MPYNGSGSFTLAQAAFVPSTPISSSAMNSDLSDIATNGLSNAVTKDGQTTITGAFKGANGSVGVPMYSFASDTNTGVYRHGADELGFATGGTLAGWFDSSQKFFMLGAADIAGALSVTGISTFTGATTFTANATFNTTDNIKIPTGTTAQRPGSPVEGNFRQNTTTHLPEVYNGSSWATMAALLVQGTFKNLSIKVASTTTVTVAADFVATTDGSSYQINPVSATINLGTNGAVNALDTGTIAIDSWYAIWVIAKSDGTTGGLASLSATAPTMPSGYTFKARVGWVQTIHGSATLYGTWQFGRQAQYVVGLAQTTQPPLMDNGTKGTYSGTAPSLLAVATTRFVPPTASRINILATANYLNNTAVSYLVAPNTNFGGTNNGPLGSNGTLWPIANLGVAGSQDVWMLLEQAAINWASSGAGGAIACLGWEDNI